MVNEAWLELANVAPEVVLPDKETRYGAGAATLIELGIRKVTRRVVPIMVVTRVAAAVTGEPEGAKARLTVMADGSIIPSGNPEPVTVTVVIPGWPVVGDVDGDSVIVA